METFFYPEIKVGGTVFYPWDAIGYDVQHFLPALLGKKPEHIGHVVVVGTCYGDEIGAFLQYPNASVYGFEPEPENYKIVSARYRNSRVRVFQLACSNTTGTAEFYETNALGNGSLLKVTEEHFAGLKKTFSVATVRLDAFAELSAGEIDLLWIDVQGAERLVLEGAEGMMSRVAAVYLEISIRGGGGYQGRVTAGEVDALLRRHGFSCVAQGINQKQQEGNALYVRTPPPAGYFSNGAVIDRLTPVLGSYRVRHVIASSPLYRLFQRFIPHRLKNWVKRKW